MIPSWIDIRRCSKFYWGEKVITPNGKGIIKYIYYHISKNNENNGFRYLVREGKIFKKNNYYEEYELRRKDLQAG